MESSDWAEDTNSGSGEVSSKMRQECKPDYEGMINEMRKKLEFTRNFYHSCEEFILHGPEIINRKHLKDLIGHLHITIKEREIALERLMEKAEKEA